jgi:adenine phosphoribosyltransferase
VDETVRDIRIVHQVDGILGEVAPEVVVAAGRALWEAWCGDPSWAVPDVLLGLDAGGIPPTMAMTLASGVPYRLAWKVDLDLPDKLRFAEPHARRTDVFVYGDLADARILLVDDEVTTGGTLANLVRALRSAGATVVGAACLVEDTTGDGRRFLESLGVPLCALVTL